MIYTVTLNPAVDRELTIDAFEFDTVLRAAEHRADVGGKGFNVSRALHAVSCESTALAFAGGKSGEQLRDGLEAVGVHTAFVWVNGETRTNVSIVSHTEGRHIKVNEPGPEVTAGDCEALRRRVRELAAPGDWWVLAGSLPPGAPATIYRDLIAVIQAAGAAVVLDSSGAALAEGCAARPRVVKPNDVELAELTGRSLETTEAILAAAREVTADMVVVSRGKQGAMLVTAGGSWMVESPTIEEKNPIGAGDALVAGLTWQLAAGTAPETALRWGVACGAAAAAEAGTAFGSLERVTALAQQVQVNALETK